MGIQISKFSVNPLENVHLNTLIEQSCLSFALLANHSSNAGILATVNRCVAVNCTRLHESNSTPNNYLPK